MVCIEDLQVRNMSKSAAGTTESPGRNVRAKSGLNKAILDQGWFEFPPPTGLQAGVERRTWLIAVPPQNTSRTCPCCSHVSAENRPTQFDSVYGMGFEENADVVGAINIKGGTRPVSL